MDRIEVSLTQAEWKIMHLLWDKHPQTLRNIQDGLKEQTSWSKHAVISFLKRLQLKNAISVEDESSPKRYFPLIKKEDAVHNETLSLVGRVYEGNIGLLVSQLVQQELTECEINELKMILLNRKGGK